MCGICGIVNFDGQIVKQSNLKFMMDCMKHRGPDDSGIFIDKNIGLGFVRLSIIDLSSFGHQPMADASNRYYLIYNGEVYNYLELRKELVQSGFKFKSNTDSEVVLYSFIKWGKDCLSHFNGMFSFLVYDTKERKIFIARDRFGIKPLYYYSDNSKFICASEILPILKIIGNKPEENNRAIFDYLAFNRTDQDETTFFKDIKKLQHGKYLTIEQNDIKINEWYNLKDNLKSPFVSSEEFKDYFVSSVGLRLRSDVPVGVCLSGGLDSSSITSVLLNDFNKSDLNTFSAVYDSEYKCNESEYIKEYSGLLNNMYYTTPTANSLFEDMDNFIKIHNEPVPSTGPYAHYKVMELAQKHVVVTLDGQGADELLAGYHYFFGVYYKELLRHFKLLKLASENYYYYKYHHSNYAFKTFLYFLLPSYLKTNLRVTEKKYLSDGFVNKYSKGNIITDELFNIPDLHSALLNHFEYKLEHLLKWEDRNSMCFSLESRVPFLDYRIVEKALSLQSSAIIDNGFTKIILRNAMKNIIPEKIRNRKDKIGFDTPEDVWFRSDRFKSFIYDMIDSESFKQRGYYDIGKIKSLYKSHLDNKINISKDIWKWINLELWFRKFIDNK
jgi:asparagine synthase (glutamine-hydrolysing)